MRFEFHVLAAAGGLLVGMLVLIRAGRWLGARHLARSPADTELGSGAIDAAVFGLLGLLIAFTFSGAAARFDARRSLIVDEGNAIGTAYLRLSVLPDPARAEIADLFRRYLDSRIETYRKLPDLDAAQPERVHSLVLALQQEIWDHAVAAIRRSDALPSAAMVVLPPLNQMFDIASTRTMATQMHPPRIFFVMLFSIALVSALLVGYGMARSRSPSWVHVIGFAAIIAVVFYVIIDVEYPRLGLFRVDEFDRVLVDLRAGMGSGT